MQVGRPPDSESAGHIALLCDERCDLFDVLVLLMDPTMLWHVAIGVKTPDRVLRRLADTGNAIVRRHLSRNPATPADVLASLAGDDDVAVRWGVANNLSTPDTVLAYLAGDENSGVRCGVAGNLRTPLDTMGRLASDQCDEVRWFVTRTLNDHDEANDEPTLRAQVVQGGVSSMPSMGCVTHTLRPLET